MYYVGTRYLMADTNTGEYWITTAHSAIQAIQNELPNIESTNIDAFTETDEVYEQAQARNISATRYDETNSLHRNHLANS